MALWEKVSELGEANQELLLRYGWQWFGTLNMTANDSYSDAENKLKEWRIKMGIKDHILVAYMGAYNTVPQPHIHLLLWGKKNRYGKGLLDINHKYWENEWSRLTKCQAVIEPIYDRGGVAYYIAEKNLPWDRSELIQPYNKRLLVKAMIH